MCSGDMRVVDRDLPDAHRGRPLPVRIYFPAHATGKWPVIVFSHGLGGSRLGYSYLGRAWAQHGYVSIHPTHRESAELRSPVAIEDIEGAAAGSATRLQALAAMKKAIDDPHNWEARPRDVALVVDSFRWLEEHVPSLRGHLDLDAIGIAGHSFGAYTTLLLAGARPRVHGHFRDFAESRGRAFLALSPPGNGSRGLEPDSWHSIARPVLCITGTKDQGLSGEPPSWRVESFHAMRGGHNALAVIDGAEHFTFSGGRPRRPANPAHLHAIEELSLAFWRRHLRGEKVPLPHLAGVRLLEK
jgi:predicted dienelactone hydrolase